MHLRMEGPKILKASSDACRVNVEFAITTDRIIFQNKTSTDSKLWALIFFNNSFFENN